MAGAPGFEPGNHGIKTRCLTTWLRPIGSAERHNWENLNCPVNGGKLPFFGENKALILVQLVNI